MSEKPTAPYTSPRLRRVLDRLPVWIGLGALLNIAVLLLTSGLPESSAIPDWNLAPFLLGVFLTFVPWLTRTLRIGIWARALGHPLSLRDATRVVLASEVIAATTPTAMGGAPAQAAFLYRSGLSSGNALAITTLSPIEDAVFFLFAVPTAVVLSPSIAIHQLAEMVFTSIESSWTHVSASFLGGASVSGSAGATSPLMGWFTIGAFVLIVIAGLFLLGRARSRIGDRVGNHGGIRARSCAGDRTANRAGSRGQVQEQDRVSSRMRLRDVLVPWRESLGTLWQHRRQLASTLPLTAIQWTSRFAVVSCVAWGLGLSVDPFLLFVLQCTLFSALTLVPTPGAAGGAEVGFFAFHQGLAGNQVGGLLFGWRMLTFFLPVTVGAILLALENRAPTDPWRFTSATRSRRDS